MAQRRIFVRRRRPRDMQWWVKPWVLRRPVFGQYASLMEELRFEDVESYKKFVWMPSEMFDELVATFMKQDTTFRKALPRIKGGSVMKIIYIPKKDWVEPDKRKKDSKGKLRLQKYTHAEVQAGKAYDFIKDNVHILKGDGKEPPKIHGAGFFLAMGAEEMNEKLGVSMQFVNEADCFTQALAYAIQNIPRRDVFHQVSKKERQFALEDNEANLQMYKGFYSGESNPTGNRVVLDSVESWFKEDGPEVLETPLIKEEDIFPCILAICGSAFGTVLVEKDGSYSTVTETRVSGKMWLGLGSILTGGKNYDQLMKLANKGNHQAIDYCMSDYAGQVEPAEDEGQEKQQAQENESGERKAGDRIIFAFAKGADKTINDFKPEDLAASLMRTMISDLVQMCHNSARIKGVNHVFLSGGFVDNPLVRKLFYEDWKVHDCQTGFLGQTKAPINCYFLKGAQHYGAFGALLHHQKNMKIFAPKVDTSEFK